MTALDKSGVAFKRAFIFSFAAHLALFLFILLSPHLPKPSRKEMIHYVNLVSFPGGGGGGPSGVGGGEVKTAETALPKRETLKDLTTLQKLQQETTSSMKYPVEKPKRETTPKKEKKASIQKQEKVARDAKAGSTPETESRKESGAGTGTGSGVRIGGGGASGSGSGSAYSSQIGLSNFPYTFYLQIIIGRTSSNWFTSLVDPGISGSFQVTVYFRIHKTGQISDLKIEESSGIKSLDMSAQRAVQSSAPFPPLPKDYEDEYLGIYLIFEHSK